MYNIKQFTPTNASTSSYEDIWHYLNHDTFLSHLSTRQKRATILKSPSYQLVHGVTFRKHRNGVLLRCLQAPYSKRVLLDLHDGPAEEISWVTLLFTKLFKFIPIGPHFSRMFMLMLTITQFVRNALENIRSQLTHCSLLCKYFIKVHQKYST